MKQTFFLTISLLCLTGCVVDIDEKLSIIPEPVQLVIHKNEVYLKSTIPECQISSAMGKEEYEIEINSEGEIKVKGGSETALELAGQTIKQLIVQGKKENGKIKLLSLKIKDFPTFRYRGAMLDCSRHFWTVDEIKKFIDIMAVHKLNVFHWHLTDNQGWRIEILKYPQLTTIGATRPESLITYHKDPRSDWVFDGKEHRGYYTQEQVQSIVNYAKSKGITIIPEFEIPGHSQAALASYPWLGCIGYGYKVQTDYTTSKEVMCAGKETTVTFIKDVLDELCELFPGEYIHIGGDEAPRDRWKECPICQRKMVEMGYESESQLQGYLIGIAEEYLKTKGKKIIGWDEILDCGISKSATVMSWRGTAGGIKAAQCGNDVIMSPSTYFYLDYWQTYSHDGEPLAFKRTLPMQQVYSFNPFDGLNKEQCESIVGIQANLWTEYVFSFEHAQKMLLPRLAAMAEIAWHGCAATSYARFLKRMQDCILPIYETEGYKYATYEFETAGQLLANLPLSPKTDKAKLERQIRKNPEQWKKAVEFLCEKELLKIPEGRHEITEDGVYANVQEYYTKDSAPFENHHKYIDIQCVVSGEEEVFVSDLSECSDRLSDYDDTADIEFFKSSAQADKVRLNPEGYLVLFPGEAHQPCISPEGQRKHIRKIVVKLPFVE